MPVRINLLSEALAAEEERRNDPVKRAMWIGVFCVFLVLLWYSTLIFEQMVSSSRLAEKKTEWSRLEPANKQLREDSNAIRVAAERIAALDRLATNRFLWAPVLNALQYTMGEDHVQLVRLNGSQTFDMVMPPPEKAPSSKAKAASAKAAKNAEDDAPAARPKGKTRTKKGKAASSTEKILLTLDARDTGKPGEQNYNAFRDALAESAYFKSMLEPGGLRLAKLLPPTSDGGGADKAFTLFTLECKFPEKERK